MWWAIDASDAVIRSLALNDVPFLLIINVGAVDSAGHHLGASGYLDVINGTDEAVMKLYQTCADHDLRFILTADHGMGFATSGAMRGGHVSDKYAERPESQRIPLIFSGSGILRGTIASGGQEDIAPTLLYQMGLPAVSCDGNPLPARGYADLRVMAGSDADVKRLGNHSVGGINQKQECTIPVIIGKIDVRLIDEENQTEKTNIHAYLALTDEIPLIIGFKDVLSSFRICFDYKKDAAWIEWLNLPGNMFVFHILPLVVSWKG